MRFVGDRTRDVWWRTVALGWPVALQQTLTTLMRTVDVVITGFFSPAAVAALGLADLYARIPLRIGMGLGSGAISLASQETGRGSTPTRDRAITQALVVGALCGLPVAAAGLVFGHTLIAVLGAESTVASLGGVYLTIIFLAAPMRIASLVGVRALQGTGDTRTPVLVNGAASALNVVLSVVFGLGVWFVPTYGIVGVGIATAVSRTVAALAIVGVLASGQTTASLAWPRDPTITRQLFAISVPSIAGGLSTSVANFPFNALLLVFGTEVAAAYHVGKRAFQQFSAPLFRAYRTVGSIVVGQELGAGRAADARHAAGAIVLLSVTTLVCTGVALFAGAEHVARAFTEGESTVQLSVGFVRTFAISLLFVGIYFPIVGALRGAGDTRTPFYAQLVGSWGFLLGASYLLGVTLGYELLGVFAGIVLSYASRVAVVGSAFRGDAWVDLAESLIAERE